MKQSELMKPHYKPDDTKFGGYIEDICLTIGTVCAHWECIQWCGDTKMLPELVNKHNGFVDVR